MSDPTDDYRVKQEHPCEGCGSHHGGPTAEILCLRRHLLAERAYGDLFRRLQAEVAQSQRDWPKVLP